MNQIKENNHIFFYFFIKLIGDNVKIGDIVTRNSYNNDTIFKIVDIKDDIYYLSGINMRLCADSYLEDLKLYNEEITRDEDYIKDTISLDRENYFYICGKIVQLDSDSSYLKRCLKYYKDNNVMAKGILLSENEMPLKILDILNEYNPDILVITGHDAYINKRNINDYKNSKYFKEAIVNARKYEKSQDKLIIIAGGCQSDYEELIKAGANFASSPKRINIHALDPAIVATQMSLSNKNDDIDIKRILESTKYGCDGMGGIITKGTMYIGYPR